MARGKDITIAPTNSHELEYRDYTIIERLMLKEYSGNALTLLEYGMLKQYRKKAKGQRVRG